MSGDIRSAFITLALSLPAIVLCLSIHETAHGGAAYLLGDRTARDSGRVTLSPMAHIDPIGFLCLLLFGFGWARPVPVNIAAKIRKSRSVNENKRGFPSCCFMSNPPSA